MKLLLVGLFLAFAACGGIGETTLRCDECFEVSVNRIVDGDTLDTNRGIIRRYGVDAPEIGQGCYSSAKGRLRDLAGNSIRLEFGPKTTGPYGRLLAYVYTEDGLSVDEILIREGLATAWTRDGQHRDRLVALDREARNKGAGCLW